MTGRKKTERILIVDDSPATIEVLQRNLVAGGYQVFSAPGVVEAIRLLDQTQVELVITDLKMPKASGLELIRHVREKFNGTEVVMITGYASIQGAVEAIKCGANEYLSKPFTDEELFAAVEKSLERRRVCLTDEPPQDAEAPSGMISESEAMKRVFHTISKAAATSATVLITGESGTGKELVARAVHYQSARATAPFVPVNCGGIPENLLESELFGHMKGSFTGATESRAGFFQTADGGTIFLDEISEMSPAMQVKLLRALQEKEVCMVGATRPQKVNVRIVSATNRDLVVLVKNDTFRADLYFRLNVIPIQIPPLRDRGDDVLLLIRHFAGRFSKEDGIPMPEFTERALASFNRYHWPGNIRELENTVQRLVIMSEGRTIDVADLPEFMRSPLPHGEGLDRTLAEVEAEHIRHVITAADGNKTRAAQVLGVNRKTLREKMKQYGIA